MDSSDSAQLQEVLNGGYSLDLGTTEIASQIAGVITVVTVISIALTIIIVVLWIIGWVHRRTVNKAILDIQKTLHEMNERQKMTSQVQQSSSVVEPPAVVQE